jgi:hypothetical protein
MFLPSNATDPADVGGDGRSGSDCGQIWIDGDLLFGSIAVAGALLAYYLYITITMKGRRRKRREWSTTNRIISPLGLLAIGNRNFLSLFFSFFCDRFSLFDFNSVWEPVLFPSSVRFAFMYLLLSLPLHVLLRVIST